MITDDDIILFVRDHTGVGEETILPDTDIFNELGCTGDDFHDLINKFAGKYAIDMSSYLWYFHADEEGQNFGGVFFRAPYERVSRIPVTPKMLAGFVNQGKWSIDYPDHKLPRFRLDILINTVFVVVVLFFAIKSCIK